MLLLAVALGAELDPAVLALGDNGDLRLSLLSQLQVRGDVSEDTAAATARVRRLRADAVVNSGPWRSRINLNLGPGSLELIEVWSGRSFGDTKARVGVLKVPFTRYREVSFADLGLVEWSPVTRAFGSERQVAGMARWTRSGWDVAGAVAQGQGVRTSHGLGVADVYGATPCAWASLTSPCPLEGVAPELVLRVGWETEGTPDVFDEARGGLRGAWTVSGAVDTEPDPRVDLAARVAAETTLAFGGVALHGGGYLGWAALPDGWAPGLVGGRIELTGVPVAGLGLAARASWVGALPALEEAAGRSWSTAEAGAGPTVPILGRALRVQADGGWVRGPDGRDGLRVQGMLQAGF